MIEDFEIFVQILLSRFKCMFFLLVVRKDRLILGVEQLGCSGAGNWASWVPNGGDLVRNLRIATSIKASIGSFALIICLGLWKLLEMGLNSRISDLRTQLRSAKFTKLLFGAVWNSSAKE